MVQLKELIPQPLLILIAELGNSVVSLLANETVKGSTPVRVSVSGEVGEPRLIV